LHVDILILTSGTIGAEEYPQNDDEPSLVAGVR
jgi:hypothetical protein